MEHALELAICASHCAPDLLHAFVVHLLLPALNHPSCTCLITPFFVYKNPVLYYSESLMHMKFMSPKICSSSCGAYCGASPKRYSNLACH